MKILACDVRVDTGKRQKKLGTEKELVVTKILRYEGWRCEQGYDRDLKRKYIKIYIGDELE